MIRIIVNNLHTEKSKVYEIEKMYDFDSLIKDYGPKIGSIVGEFKNVRSAADAVAEYLSNHHLEAEVIDPSDSEEIYDPNVEQSVKQEKDAKEAIDLKDLLETYDQASYVDIPEMHVIASATHRWDSALNKSEALEKSVILVNIPISGPALNEALESSGLTKPKGK